MLQLFPSNAIKNPLTILNKLLFLNKIPDSWTVLNVIPIHKPNSTTYFRPIAFSSVLCKIFEYIFKNKLDWWLESNSLLSNNPYALRRETDTSEYLANFLSKIYQSFNNQQFFTTSLVIFAVPLILKIFLNFCFISIHQTYLNIFVI